MEAQLSLTQGHGLPVGIGKVIASTGYGSAGSYMVQTPDAMWDLMIARMGRQVDARDAAMSRWERRRRPGGYPDAAYWIAYQAEKSRHRVDYPMPWGHVMFA